jgi:hypothetical protein
VNAIPDHQGQSHLRNRLDDLQREEVLSSLLSYRSRMAKEFDLR